MNRPQAPQRMSYLVLVACLISGCAVAPIAPDPTTAAQSDAPPPLPTPFPPTPTPAPSEPPATSAPPPTATPIPPSSTPTVSTLRMGYYRFTVGEFECICLYDCSYNYPLSDLFAGASISSVKAELEKHDLATEYATTPYTLLYVDTGEHQVLVDMGIGKEGMPSGKLLWRLEAASIDPAEIDIVLITHAHPDHVGGTQDENDQLIYANANYYVSQDEWDFWFSQEASTGGPAYFAKLAQESLEAVSDRLVLVQGETEVVPGISMIPAPGHTPGHMMVSVSSGGEFLLYAADVATHVLHLEHPTWHTRYEVAPQQAADTKRRVFDWVAHEGFPVVATHFGPFPSLGTVARRDEGWEWQPLVVPE